VPPYDWDALLESLAAQALPGVELVTGGVYRRTLELASSRGVLEVAPCPGKHSLRARLELADVRALPAVISRVRGLFDLACDVTAIGAQLGEDPLLASRVALRPGLRVPGAWDAFELAARLILAEDAAEVARSHGDSLEPARPGLRTFFPGPARLARAELASLGGRRETALALRALARAVVADPGALARGADLESTLARLRKLPGVDELMAQTIAMRALGEPDAFPLADPALRAQAERWRPWRAYAAQHLSGPALEEEAVA
jgi:AraC family transcriptional regulator, regulatory protein of adaptative response / DNA-3-methyladenine glycosylase II